MWYGFHPEVATGFVKEARIRAEILPDHPPKNSKSVARVVRREDAGIEESVVIHNAVAELDEIVEHRPEIGDQHRRRSAIVNDPVHGHTQFEFLVAKHRLVTADDI